MAKRRPTPAPVHTVARAVRHPVQTVTTRPAETSPWVAIAVAAFASIGVKLSADQLRLLVLVVAAAPGAVTWFVAWRRSRSKA